MGRGAWWAAVPGVAASQTRLSDFTFTFHFHALEKEMATHSSVLAWRVPGMGEPGGLPSLGSQSRTRLKWLSSSLCILSMHIYCILYWKLKTEWLLHVWILSSWDHVVDGSCGSLLLPSIQVSDCIITSLGKLQISKFEVQFLLNRYCFHNIVKLKNHKLNHCKSGTTGICFLLQNPIPNN